jgi:hypothetical protein
MLYCAVAVAFLAACRGLYLLAVADDRAAGEARKSVPTNGSVDIPAPATDDPVGRAERWTALDDLQVARLLDGSR